MQSLLCLPSLLQRRHYVCPRVSANWGLWTKWRRRSRILPGRTKKTVKPNFRRNLPNRRAAVKTRAKVAQTATVRRTAIRTAKTAAPKAGTIPKLPTSRMSLLNPKNPTSLMNRRRPAMRAGKSRRTILTTGNRPCRKSLNTYTCFCIIRRLPQPAPKTAERNTGTAPSAADIIPTPRRKTRYRKRKYPFPQQVTITNTKSLCRLARKRGMPNMCAAPAATGMKRTVPALSLRGTHSANGRPLRPPPACTAAK